MIRRFILDLMEPVLLGIRKIRLPAPRLDKRVHLEQLGKILSPGQLILSRSDLYLTNVFNSGVYKHSSVYIGHGRVVEAVWPKVRIIPLEDWLKDKSHIVLLENTAIENSHEWFELVKIAEAVAGSEYDMDFHIEYEFEPIKRYYCHELGWYLHNQVAPKTLPDPKFFMGSHTILADDFLKDPTTFRVVWALGDPLYKKITEGNQ